MNILCGLKESYECGSASHDQSQTWPGSYSPFETPMRVLQLSFLLASSHHIDMNFCYTFLSLLVVLSAYSESPQHGKPPDSLDLTVAAVCPNSSSNLLGVLAPVLLQTEVSGSVLSRNMVLPHEVYNVLPLNEVGPVLQNGVYQFILPQNQEVSKKSSFDVMPQKHFPQKSGGLWQVPGVLPIKNWIENWTSPPFH